MTLLDLCRITALSWKLPLVAWFSSGAHYAFLVFNTQDLKYGAGPVIALVNTMFTLIMMDRVQRFLQLEAQADAASPGAPTRAPGRTRIGPRKWASGNN